jgi:DNA-binding CsgD family transcriptional regulator
MLAWGYCRRGVLRFIGPGTEADLSAADAAAQRLKQLDEGNHAAYAILGHIGMRRLRHAESLANLQLAHRINPNDVTTLRWLSWEESNFGFANEARAHADLSMVLGPHGRSLDQGHWALALAEYVAGNLDRCMAQARQAVALNRAFTGHHILLIAALAESGALDEARAMAESLARQTPGLLESRLTGSTYFAIPALAERYVRALSLAVGPLQRAADPRGSPLTERETQVLKLIAAGLSNAAAAGELGLSEHTVKRHVANILTKLDLPTRAAAAAAAGRLGLL